MVVRDPADLRDVGRCRDGEGVSIESEGDIRHALDVLAVHCGLWEEHYAQRRYIYWCFTGFQLKQVTKSFLIIFFWEFWRQSIKVCLLWVQKMGEKLLHMVWCDGMTHLSVLVGWGSNPGVHVVDVTVWANDQGGTSVNDGLAATRAGHGLSVDGNAVRREQQKVDCSLARKLFAMFSAQYMFFVIFTCPC